MSFKCQIFRRAESELTQWNYYAMIFKIKYNSNQNLIHVISTEIGSDRWPDWNDGDQANTFTKLLREILSGSMVNFSKAEDLKVSMRWTTGDALELVERNNKFDLLGSIINSIDDETEQIKRRSEAGKKSYQHYKELIYVEAWVLTDNSTALLDRFERKVSRRISEHI